MKVILNYIGMTVKQFLETKVVLKLQFCLFLMLLNQLMTSLVFFHWLSLVAFRRFIFILSSIVLLILPSSFFDGFSRRIFGLFKKFSLWSFSVMKQLLLPLINILSNAVLFSIIFLPSLLILLFIWSGTFL